MELPPAFWGLEDGRRREGCKDPLDVKALPLVYYIISQNTAYCQLYLESELVYFFIPIFQIVNDRCQATLRFRKV
jgi:hypothetical protein